MPPDLSMMVSVGLDGGDVRGIGGRCARTVDRSFKKKPRRHGASALTHSDGARIGLSLSRMCSAVLVHTNGLA